MASVLINDNENFYGNFYVFFPHTKLRYKIVISIQSTNKTHNE